jgi:hypothetical protein
MRSLTPAPDAHARGSGLPRRRRARSAQQGAQQPAQRAQTARGIFLIRITGDESFEYFVHRKTVSFRAAARLDLARDYRDEHEHESRKGIRAKRIESLIKGIVKRIEKSETTARAIAMY